MCGSPSLRELCLFLHFASCHSFKIRWKQGGEGGPGLWRGALLLANQLLCRANVSPAAHLQGLGFF